MAVGQGGLVDGVDALAAWLLRRRDSTAKANARRRFAIHAYVGANGGGKSLAAGHDTLVSLREGRPALSTMRFLDFDDPHVCRGDNCDDPANHDTPTGVHWAAHPLYVPLRDYRQLIEFREGDVVLDEVTGIASSRESHAMPVQVVNYLMQLRRRDVLLRWTAPNWARADKVIREVTQAVTDCSGAMPVTRSRGDGTTRLWRDRRLFSWATFDAFSFDEFSAHKRDTLKPLVRQRLWRPGSVCESAYDTLDPVLALGWANDSGMCMVCGGRRRVPSCSCAEHPAVSAGSAGVPTTELATSGGALPVVRSRASRRPRGESVLSPVGAPSTLESI